MNEPANWLCIVCGFSFDSDLPKEETEKKLKEHNDTCCNNMWKLDPKDPNDKCEQKEDGKV